MIAAQITGTNSPLPGQAGIGSSARGDYRLVPSEYPFMASDSMAKSTGYADLSQQGVLPAEGAPQALPPQTCCERGEALLHNSCFQCFEALLIVGNAAVIGMETDMTSFKHWNDIENGFLLVFLLELIYKIIVIGPLRYFNCNDPEFCWNAFDVAIVGLGCFDATMILMFPNEDHSGNFATLFRMVRLLRILRIFRIVKFLKELYVLAFGLVEAVKAVFWVTVLMFFVLYVCSIVLVKTVGQTSPDDKNYEFLTYRYGSIIDSMLTLFVLMSSPNFVIYQDEDGLLDAHPPFVVFLIMFITFGSFGMIALLTGVISESMFQKNEVRKEQVRIEQEEMKEHITRECASLFTTVEIDGCTEVKVEEVQTLTAELCSMLAECGIQFSHADMSRIIGFMDIDGTGLIGIDEFVSTMLKVADGLGPMSIQELQNRVGTVERKVDRVQETLNECMASTNDKLQVISMQVGDLVQALRVR
jgi:voltage-gated sodium channel